MCLKSTRGIVSTTLSTLDSQTLGHVQRNEIQVGGCVEAAVGGVVRFYRSAALTSATVGHGEWSRWAGGIILCRNAVLVALRDAVNWLRCQLA